MRWFPVPIGNLSPAFVGHLFHVGTNTTAYTYYHTLLFCFTCRIFDQATKREFNTAGKPFSFKLYAGELVVESVTVGQSSLI